MQNGNPRTYFSKSRHKKDLEQKKKDKLLELDEQVDHICQFQCEHRVSCAFRDFLLFRSEGEEEKQQYAG